MFTNSSKAQPSQSQCGALIMWATRIIKAENPQKIKLMATYIFFCGIGQEQNLVFDRAPRKPYRFFVRIAGFVLATLYSSSTLTFHMSCAGVFCLRVSRNPHSFVLTPQGGTRPTLTHGWVLCSLHPSLKYQTGSIEVFRYVFSADVAFCYICYVTLTRYFALCGHN